MLFRNLLPLLLMLAAICSGCSTFPYEWRKAANKPTPTNDITGRWEGRWLSHANGHNDAMRCLISRVDTNHYDAKFHAAYSHSKFKWLKIHFGYKVRLEATPAVHGVTFRGQEDLGALAGGIYTYGGHATPTNFFSTYQNKYDHGIFEMGRPAEADAR